MRSAALAATAIAATAITALERLILDPGFSRRLVVNFLGMYSLSWIGSSLQTALDYTSGFRKSREVFSAQVRQALEND